MIVVSILLERNVREKNNTNKTLGSSGQHHFSDIDDHPQIVIHTFHHSTRTQLSPTVVALHLVVAHLEVILSHRHPECRHSQE